MNKALQIFISAVVIMLVLAGYGTAVTLGNLTFINGTLVWLGCILLSALISVATQRPLRYITRNNLIWVNYVASFVAMTGILAGLFYAINFFAIPTNSEPYELKLPVERLASETHYRTKRVGRRNVGQEPYLVYRAYYRMPDGKRRHFDLRVEDFAKARRTDSVEVSIVKGVLGAEVIKSQKLIRTRRAKKKR